MENPFRLLRQGVGAQIKILGLQTQQRIPDAAAYGVSGEPRTLQRVDTGCYIVGQEHPHTSQSRYSPVAAKIAPARYRLEPAFSSAMHRNRAAHWAAFSCRPEPIPTSKAVCW